MSCCWSVILLNCHFRHIPEYKVYTKKCKHDDAIANYSCGIADLVEEEKPLIHQPAGDKDDILVLRYSFQQMSLG